MQTTHEAILIRRNFHAAGKLEVRIELLGRGGIIQITNSIKYQ